MRFHRCAAEIVARSGRSPFRHLGFTRWFVDMGPDPRPPGAISTAHAQPWTITGRPAATGATRPRTEPDGRGRGRVGAGHDALLSSALVPGRATARPRDRGGPY